MIDDQIKVFVGRDHEFAVGRSDAQERKVVLLNIFKKGDTVASSSRTADRAFLAISTIDTASSLGLLLSSGLEFVLVCRIFLLASVITNHLTFSLSDILCVLSNASA